MAITEAEERRKLEQDAIEKFGKTLEDLNEEELEALYTAYQAEREVLSAEYQRGAGMEGNTPSGRQAGNIYRAAGGLEHLGGLARSVAGAKIRRDATQGLDKLAEREKMGRRAGGEVAANRFADMIRAYQDTKQTAPSGPQPPPPAPPAASPQPPAPNAPAPAQSVVAQGVQAATGQAPPAPPATPAPQAPRAPMADMPPFQMNDQRLAEWRRRKYLEMLRGG